MKKIITIIVMLFSIALYSPAQNFVAAKKTKTVYTDTTTTYTYQIQDIKYPVFKSKRGAFYIYKRISKTNKIHKCYLPKEVQIKMGRTYNISK